MSWMKRVLIYAGLAPFLFIALFPVLWMVITAFKHERDLYSMRGIPFWFYEPPTLKHFHLLFTQTWFGTWFVNTAMVSVCVVVITVATAVPAGYALARLRLPGAGHTATAIFMTYLVPPIILFLPLTYVIGQLGLFDSCGRWCSSTRPSPSRSPPGSCSASCAACRRRSRRRRGWTAAGASARSCTWSCP